MCYRLVSIFGLWFSLLIWTKLQHLRLVLYFARWDTNLNEGLDMVTVVLGYWSLTVLLAQSLLLVFVWQKRRSSGKSYNFY